MKYLLPFFFVLLGMNACKPEQAKETAPEDRNFSIRRFAAVQWFFYAGAPYSFERIIVLNGHRDTSYVSAMNMNWAPVFKIFLATDISDPKFSGKYKFSSFEENTTVTVHNVYEATEPELFTRTLHVIADQENPDKIHSVYVETRKENGNDVIIQRLLYAPQKKLQIQEVTSSGLGPDKEFLAEYRFL